MNEVTYSNIALDLSLEYDAETYGKNKNGELYLLHRTGDKIYKTTIWVEILRYEGPFIVFRYGQKGIDLNEDYDEEVEPSFYSKTILINSKLKAWIFITPEVGYENQETFMNKEMYLNTKFVIGIEDQIKYKKHENKSEIKWIK